MLTFLEFFISEKKLVSLKNTSMNGCAAFYWKLTRLTIKAYCGNTKDIRVKIHYLLFIGLLWMIASQSLILYIMLDIGLSLLLFYLELKTPALPSFVIAWCTWARLADATGVFLINRPLLCQIPRELLLVSFQYPLQKVSLYLHI